MEETISLKEIFEVIKKRILLIITLIVAAALISAIVTFYVLTPNYEASSQFIVNQSQQKQDTPYSVTDIQTSQQLINTYNIIIKSPAILEEVVNELNLDISAAQLQNKLTVSSAEKSQVVTVKVTDPNPNQAQKIANTTVSVFQKKIPDIMNVNNVSILSKADVGENPAPISPKPMLNIAIAIVLGGMIGVGLAFLLAYLDNTIKSEEDIADKLDVPVLGIITHIDDKDIRPDNFQAAALSRRKRGGFSGSQKESI
ncbi:YveK family protein [Virgibacillus ihumii]|uniref:YveK family protein n=1 Tax=Virgibacillus ihumii TaxID=2686091 RepID=UPI00157DED94|nr:Wzz/FepE/Etk N-terminal domain-containing protein [Virgibacillus ihumii]